LLQTQNTGTWKRALRPEHQKLNKIARSTGFASASID